MPNDSVTYAGFWVRFFASLLDTLFLALPLGVLIYFLSDGAWFDLEAFRANMAHAISGNAHKALATQPQTSLKWELLFEMTLLVVSALFWKRFKGATPGKRAMGIVVVDAKTFGALSNRQAFTRSIGYIPSAFLLFGGFLLVLFRRDKRALHDLIADTAVIYANAASVTSMSASGGTSPRDSK